jgi:hypothetical protein
MGGTRTYILSGGNGGAGGKDSTFNNSIGSGADYYNKMQSFQSQTDHVLVAAMTTEGANGEKAYLASGRSDSPQQQNLEYQGSFDLKK